MIPLSVIFVLILFTYGKIAYSAVLDISRESATTFSDGVAQLVTSTLENITSQTKLVVSVIEDGEDLDSIKNLSRSAHFSLIESNKNIYSSWYILDPNEAYGHTGFEKKAYIKNNGKINESPGHSDEYISGPDTFLVYKLVKRTDKNYIYVANGFNFNTGKGTEYNATVVYPIHFGGKIIGISGVAVLYSDLFSFMDNFQIEDKRSVFLLSSTGIILYSSDTKQIGKPITDVAYNDVDNLSTALAKEDGYFETSYSKLYKTECLQSFHPINVESGDSTIYLFVNMPTDVIKEKAHSFITQFIITFALGISFFTVCLFLAVRGITKPIQLMTQDANEFAKGDLSVNFNHNKFFKSNTRYELDILQNSFSMMVFNLNEMVVRERETVQKLKIYSDMLIIAQENISIHDAFFNIMSYICNWLEIDVFGIVSLEKDSPVLIESFSLKNYEENMFDEDELSIINNNFILNSDENACYEFDYKSSKILTLALYEYGHYSGFIILKRVSDLKEFCEDEKLLYMDIVRILSNLILRGKIENDRLNFKQVLENSIEERTNELKLMTLKANEEKEKANSATEAKSKFLATMSHEIRTPMNAILGMSNILLEEQLDNKQHEYVKNIKVSSTLLLDIINDILDLSKLETAKLFLAPINYNLRLVIDHICSITSFLANSKNLKFTYNTKNELPSCIYGDDVRLRQVLLNILGNAVKFTKKGGITFTIECTDENLIFTVVDTGSGIEKESIPFIFNAFNQINTVENRYIKGTGLGLSISKSLVEMMGGTISVTSVLKQGSSFVISVPKIVGDENKLSMYEDSIKLNYNFNANVLVVDDNEINLHVASGLLALNGVECVVAKSGAEALELVTKHTFDLIFIDYMMPVMDGIETMLAIKSLGVKYEKIPIIASTANVVSGMQEMFIESGMDDILPKPIELLHLQNILKKWIPYEENQTIIENDSNSVDMHENNFLSMIQKIDELNTKEGLNSCSGNIEVYKNCLQLLIDSIPIYENQITLSLKNKNLKEYLFHIHKVKGSLQSIGAISLGNLSKKLEYAADSYDLETCDFYTQNFIERLNLLQKDISNVFGLEKESMTKKEGSVVFLEKSIFDILLATKNYDYENLTTIFEELGKFSFGSKHDESLSLLENKFRNFDFLGIVEVIKSNFKDFPYLFKNKE